MKIKIKLNGSLQNKAKGFYFLITNGNTYSNNKDEFIIEEKLIQLLKDKNIKFIKVKNKT